MYLCHSVEQLCTGGDKPPVHIAAGVRPGLTECTKAFEIDNS